MEPSLLAFCDRAYNAASMVLTNFRCASAILSSSRISLMASREFSSVCSVRLRYSRRCSPQRLFNS